MQRTNAVVWALVFLVGVLGGGSVMLRSVRAQAPAIDRPGDAKYTPTKLEWAALELQTNYGQNWTSENRVGFNFSPLGDGKTVLCWLQFTPDVSAETVKTDRELNQVIFDRFAMSRGWPWLQLQFRESTLPRPNVTVQ